MNSNPIQLNFNLIKVKSNLIYVYFNLMQFFSIFFYLLDSYQYNFLHSYKFLHMVCIKKFSFITNDIINNLSA